LGIASDLDVDAREELHEPFSWDSIPMCPVVAEANNIGGAGHYYRHILFAEFDSPYYKISTGLFSCVEIELSYKEAY
jgi:hypothetical protein